MSSKPEGQSSSMQMYDEEGDPFGFELAFEGLFVRCARLAYRLLGDQSVAEEVAAETMARAYANWSKVSVMKHRDAWVLRVATNLAVDRGRQHRWQGIIGSFRLEDRVSTSSESEMTALRITLVAALARLPRRQREVVVLRHLSGLSESEVAGVTGLALGTVKTHLRRGLDSLRDLLGEEARTRSDNLAF